MSPPTMATDTQAAGPVDLDDAAVHGQVNGRTAGLERGVAYEFDRIDGDRVGEIDRSGIGGITTSSLAPGTRFADQLPGVLNWPSPAPPVQVTLNNCLDSRCSIRGRRPPFGLLLPAFFRRRLAAPSKQTAEETAVILAMITSSTLNEWFSTNWASYTARG